MDTLSLQIYHGSGDFPVNDFADALEDLNYRIEIVLIDENSSAENPVYPDLASPVKVVRIRNTGNFNENFSEAMKSSTGDFIVVSDSARGLNAELIRRMLEKAGEGYDLVVASRGKVRNVKTILAKVLVRELSGLSDPLSSVFVVRRWALEDLDFNTGIQTVLAEILIRNRVERIAEVPVSSNIKERKTISFLQYFSYIYSILRLSKFRVIKFGLVGLSGVGINEGFLYLFHNILGIYDAGLSFFILPVSLVIAIEASVIWNFSFNNRWTFADRKGGNVFVKLFKYNVFTGIGAIVNIFSTVAFTDFRIIPDYLIANIAGIFIGFLINYFSSDYLVWKVENRSKI
ncbi:MAG: GtrA family protein [Thermoplasmataceae archaeon]|jgi:dolichol-phosphate mannosyltransferase